jgi:hypothetical protein
MPTNIGAKVMITVDKNRTTPPRGCRYSNDNDPLLADRLLIRIKWAANWIADLLAVT